MNLSAVLQLFAFDEERFSRPLLAWYDQYGRKNLPWKNPLSAYRVWVSEIMLQQTQVKTVLPYFERFMQAFPTLEILAKASEEEVLTRWAGLGYYSRARNLLKTAQIIAKKYDGELPSSLDALKALPGIGDSTAAAIASQAFNQAEAILDGNVQRILARYFKVDGDLKKAAAKKMLFSLAKRCMPQERCADYTQAIMDLGALCCLPKLPLCETCPLQKDCQAYQSQSVAAYPQKATKKILPIKSTQFFVFYSKNKAVVYLEKRPSLGLWGGLWCFPQQADRGLMPEDCAANQGFLATDTTLALKAAFPAWTFVGQKSLARFKHSFTHFHLHIHALAIEIEQVFISEKKEREEPLLLGTWFDLPALATLAVPKPIRFILDIFLNEQQSYFIDPEV